MIDLPLIKSALVRLNLSMCNMDLHGGKLLSELQNIFGTYAGENAGSLEVRKFDAFEFAWDRLPRSDKFRFIALSQRKSMELFQDVKMDSPVKWGDFTLGQQAVLYRVAAGTLVAAATLFCDEGFSRDFAEGFKRVMQERQAVADQAIVSAVRGVA